MLEAAETSMPRHLEEVIKPTHAVQLALHTTATKLHWILQVLTITVTMLTNT